MQASRRTLVFCSGAAALVGGALLPASASAGLLSPDSPASSSASDIQTTVVVMVVVTIVVALAAIVALLRSVRRGASERRTRGTGSIQARVIAGLSAAVAVVFVFGVVMTENARTDDSSGPDGAAPISVGATAQQWLWRYEYPIPPEIGVSPNPGIFSYYELVLPVDTPVELRVDSTDVQHSWWVPALAPQTDANPAEEPNTVSFTPTEIGTFEGRSTKFSGPAYTAMRTRVTVVSAEDYQQWLAEQADRIQAANADVQQRIDTGNLPGESDEGGLGQPEAGAEGTE